MRVLHSGTLDVNAGGPAMSIYDTLYGLKQIGVNAEIIMYPTHNNGNLRGTNITIHYTPKPLEGKFAYSPFYKRDVKKLGDFDVYHAQGIWQYPTYALIDVARYKQKPYLITPRGMLYPQDIAKSNKRFKEWSLKLRLLNDLNKAACVHVTCEDEMRYCRNLGVTAPIAIIPNPIIVKEYTYKKKDSIFRIGYLGRLSPRKNIESLIYALAELKSEKRQAELLIIGGGDNKYERFLRDEAQRLKLDNVFFTGFLSGKKKDEAIASLSILVMPSEFENFGNVILEGLIRGIPCIATKGSPWKELVTRQCGWWIDYEQETINKTIKEAMRIPPYQLATMGERGIQLIKDNYSQEKVAAKMKELYEWICGKTDKPQFTFMQ